MYFLEAQNIKKSYHIGRKTVGVLDGVSFGTERGESLAVTGSSGAGKSTLLNVLGLLDKPDAGTIFFDGEDVTSLSAKKQALFRGKRIGFVFQSFQLFQEMNVIENVMLPAFALKHKRDDLKERAVELLAAVGMQHRLDHKPVELSGGEQQRVALARALMNEPDIILADEPTGNLDDSTGLYIMDMLFDLVKDMKVGLICVTHNKNIAGLCDKQLSL